MKISVAADERTGVAETLVEELRRRGHEPLLHGALEPVTGKRALPASLPDGAFRSLEHHRAHRTAHP